MMRDLPDGWFEPAWTAPDVSGLFTGRRGGVSGAPWDDGSGGGGCDLALHVDDAPEAVAANRAALAARLGGVRVAYLQQVHGVDVVDLDRWDGTSVPRADAAVCATPGLAACVLVADCLPVLLAAPGAVGAAHAGWRGLAGGVLENTVAAVCAKAGCDAAVLHAWLGPAIGPEQFEVGGEVRDAFVACDPGAAAAFVPGRPGRPGKWLADLFALARLRLVAAGVQAERIGGGGVCTVSHPRRYYSYRRDGVTGRQAGLIWLVP